MINQFLDKLKSGCSKCSLSNIDHPPIVYRGNLNSKILLLAEAPGLVEMQTGEPFRGPSGQLLDKIFESVVDLDTNKHLLLSNVCYCKPIAPEGIGKQNVTPNETQIKACRPHVQEFIDIIDPKIIIACGRIALSSLLHDYKVRLKDYEGKWSYIPKEDKKDISLFTMTHPAHLLYLSNDPEKEFEAKQKVFDYMTHFKYTYKDFL